MDSDTKTIHISFREKETHDVKHGGKNLLIYVILFVSIVFLIAGLLGMKKMNFLYTNKKWKLVTMYLGISYTFDIFRI